MESDGSGSGGVTGVGAGLFTTAEIRYLIAKLTLAAANQPLFVWAWSIWRRKHQANAAAAHRRTRQNMQL